MAGRLATFLKEAWAKEPVLVASFTIGSLAIILPAFSPFTKYAAMINQVTPYNYPGLYHPASLCPLSPLGFPFPL
ncbi:NADH dehydrogenase [ubiquinone] 1 alpha subcomplex subunit 3 isoform X2 [Lutra lutra]|uniref:NADH dehydrogenase [ubiquinone] 1 alpha subcomplex subunit 3 isoform X2 n=1 Tax=Lutra lutra TaxID=9657 RepID=UPI001FD60720|nr:NADH dehydrogenase [ubiquinone] 1 alpha subcomplex subunit 3 isoform X2 [Lutra lutra]